MQRKLTKQECEAMDKAHRWRTIRKNYAGVLVETDPKKKEILKRICRENLAQYEKLYPTK